MEFEVTDTDLVERVRAGEHGLYEVLMRRHNERLYRAARAIVGDEADVEDVMQQTYMNAFSHLHQFESRARFSTWLTRILVNEASHRLRAKQQSLAINAFAPEMPARALDGTPAPDPSPEQRAYAGELRRALEEGIDALPDRYRLVFMLRDVEGMSTAETAVALGLSEEAVKTRLHRGRATLRRLLTARFGATVDIAFPFHAPRCDRVVAAVLKQLALRDTASGVEGTTAGEPRRTA